MLKFFMEHLDKKVILWHRESTLFLRLYWQNVINAALTTVQQCLNIYVAVG